MLRRGSFTSISSFFVGATALIGCLQSVPAAWAQAHHGHGKRTGLPIELEYACGNGFVITNPNVEPVSVVYKVVGTKEKKSVFVPGAAADEPGYTEKLIKTQNPGTVELYVNDRRASSQPNDRLPCVANAANAVRSAAAVVATDEPDPSVVGSWSQPAPWPVIAIHLHLLPDGRVLSFGKSGYPQIWDPVSGEFTSVPAPINVFCAGHAFLENGKLLVVGGHINNRYGLPGTNLFDFTSASWIPSATMPLGRWYPTATTMASGDVLITAGTDENAQNVLVPEIWSNDTLRSLNGASRALLYYPRAFLAPNGKVFFAGGEVTSKYLDTSGEGVWTTVGRRKAGSRSNGPAVMYEPGKVLYAGGGRSTNTAETIDLNQSKPVWTLTASMEFARHHSDLTILPTGDVLTTGGVGGIANNDLNQAVLAAEIWNPATGTWRTVASATTPRGYHETAVLLPDGRVLKAGSGEGAGGPPQRNFELYSPPYLFAGPRPTIASAPEVAPYGQIFRVETPDAAMIQKISLIRLGSVTHAFDMNQRYQTLSFTADETGLVVTGPDNRNVTPPGHYMLFVLNEAGVPSEAKIVQVQ